MTFYFEFVRFLAILKPETLDFHLFEISKYLYCYMVYKVYG